jgi:hypothetical protein
MYLLLFEEPIVKKSRGESTLMGIEKTSLIHSHLPICLDVTINKRHNCRCKNNCAPQSKGMFRMQCSKHTQQASNW